MEDGVVKYRLATTIIVARRKRYQTTVITGMAIMTVGIFLFTRMTGQTSLLMIVFSLVLFGLGTGTFFAVQMTAAQNAIPQTQLGVGTGSIRYLAQLGPTLGAAVIGTIVNSALSASLPATPAARLALAGALQPGFLVVLALSLLILVIAFFLKDVPMTQPAKNIVEYRGEKERSCKVSQTDPAPSDPHPEVLLAAPEEQNKQLRKAFRELFEGITPWLVEFGSWLFGGLIALNLLVVAALITVGPVDPTIKISTAAFALALPLEVAGLFLLRLERDLKQVGFEEEMAQAFQEVRFTGGEQVVSSAAVESVRKRRTGIIMSYSFGILTLSFLLTLTGMMAALWHMAWWIGVVFFAMILLSLGLVIIVLVTSQPPDSAEKERKRRFREEMTRQAKKQGQQNETRIIQ